MLQKDLCYLEELERLQEGGVVAALDQLNLAPILRPYHPRSPEAFAEECAACVALLRRFVSSALDEGRRPIMITDWDGTMKDYCSQYATNLQVSDENLKTSTKRRCSGHNFFNFGDGMPSDATVVAFQPIYSAVGLARFSEKFTRLTAVLTAGPLRGPGILDLTALPIDGPVVFSGSWGREWWLRGQRLVHDDGIPSEGIDALEQVNNQVGHF